jgi:intracellular sulfur oxidation DsrE/DsrF family protein
MMSDAYPDSQFEVVVFGNAMTMLIKDKSTLSGTVENLAARNNVVFKACEVSMKRHNVDKNGLIMGVQTVPDGIVELVTKQNEGWGYIKE